MSTTLVVKSCIVCGNEFTLIYDSKKGNSLRNTCSNKCRYVQLSQKFSKKEIRACLYCGKEFMVAKSLKKYLCSSDCRRKYMSQKFSGAGNPFWKETKRIRKASRRSLRNKIVKRDKSCQICNSVKNLQVHHNDRNPDNNSDENLILLCKSCHAEWHNKHGGSNLVKLIMSNRTYKNILRKVCSVCKCTFQPSKNSQITCSKRCAAIQSGITRRKF